MSLHALRAAPVAALLLVAACTQDSPTDATAVPGGGPSESTLVNTSQSLTEFSEAFDINSAGVIVGRSWADGPRVAAIWNAAGVMDTLTGVGRGYDDWANGINDLGRVVGWSADSGYVYRGVLWTSPSAAPVILPGLGSHTYAYAINRAGMMAGASITGSSQLHAVVWTPDRVLHDIDPAGTWSMAAAVNDSGKVAGTVVRAGRKRAFLWTQAGGMQLLPVGGDSSFAHGINTRGEVVGSFSAGAQPHAFLWSPATGFRDLGATALPGYGIMSAANDINDAGVVAGEFGAYTNRGAAAWAVRSGTRSLEPPAHESSNSRAMAINRHGQVVGSRRGYNSWTFATRWTVTEVNTRPSLSFASTAITVNEGDTIALGLSATDAEGDALSYNWSFGDGTSLSVPATTAAPAMRRHWNDDGTYTLRVIAIDPSGTRDTATATVTVLNRAPAGTFTAPAYTYEGRTYLLTLTALKDGPADLRAGVQVAFDCGAGYGAWALATRVTCPAVADDDSVSIGVRLRDNDGAVTEYRRPAFIIYNAAPVVAATAVTSTSVSTGIQFQARGQFSDTGKQDGPWLVRYYWGDGTYSSTTVTAQGWVPAMSHAYRAAGTYSVTVYVTDKDGRNGKSTPITVTVG